MCFAPQRRALFRHLNFQKWSEHGVFCTFWLGNVLRATTACTFSTSQLPKVLRDPGALYLFTSKSASGHNGVQFFISHLASWLRTRRFSEPTVRPSGAPNHWKNTVFRDFPTFSRICIFFLLTLSLLIFSLLIFLFSLPLPCSAFHLFILSEVWLLNFPRWFNKDHEDPSAKSRSYSCSLMSSAMRYAMYGLQNRPSNRCWSFGFQRWHWHSSLRIPPILVFAARAITNAIVDQELRDEAFLSGRCVRCVSCVILLKDDEKYLSFSWNHLFWPRSSFGHPWPANYW